jgi:hypothetical protein
MSVISAPQPQTKAVAPSTPQTSFRVLALKVAMLLLILTVGGELVCRAFWMFDRRAPLLSPRILWYAYYPQLRSTGVEKAAEGRSADTFDILILGGSTISENYGTIGTRIRDAYKKQTGKTVRLFNLAYPAHNSRDSMLKYRWLADQHFDLVVAYDGVNDTRMNNTPPGLFRDDYSHCLWYRCVNRLDEHPDLNRLALPFTMQHLTDRIYEEAGLEWCASRLNPTEETTKYGSDVRTHTTFQRNLEELVETAKKRQERIVVMTFAYYVPDNYSLEACEAGTLDYATPTKTPIEIWGTPENVVQALKQQNVAVRELAKRHPEAVFVDQERLMTRTGKNFVDCCHFTDPGCVEFTGYILAALAAQK